MARNTSTNGNCLSVPSYYNYFSHMQKVEFVRTGYGKKTVKVLVVRRQGRQHSIIEVKADVELTLKSRKDYLTGDNSDIIPTDTIKNTVHGLAKLRGVSLTPF